MNAIVPLNITALRVSPTDNTNIVTMFKGRMAYFENLPYMSGQKDASTGDRIIRPLDSPDSPLAPLYSGIHLHWELPDYFRKGVQLPGGNTVVFPQVPNRWLVVRYLQLYDDVSKSWGALTSNSWVVESDFISEQPLRDPDGVIRPTVPVPLPYGVQPGQQPYRWMGRVLPTDSWPSPTGASYLSDFKGSDGQPYYLSSIGFLGESFSSYYPDCCSVFGFMDRFLDVPSVADALKNSSPIQFKASYQVCGWIENGADPLDGFDGAVTAAYNQYVDACKQNVVPINQTPADYAVNIAKEQFNWLLHKEAISFTLQSDQKIATLTVPEKSICAGMMEEIVWDMMVSPGTSSFLGNPDNPSTPYIWQENDLKIAVGNTSVEALSALLKNDGGDLTDPDLLKSYEYLLDALQLGLLNTLETENNNIAALEEALHSAGYAREQGGMNWIIQQKTSDNVKPVDPDMAIDLPLDISEQLSLLNQAQKNYDMGRSALIRVRKQLYMDWYRYIKMYAGGVISPNVSINTLTNFLNTGSSELAGVIDTGEAIGLLMYVSDPDNDGVISGVKKPAGSDLSAAYKVWDMLGKINQVLVDYPDWEIMAVPGSTFWLPTAPVAVMEGSRMQPVYRNGQPTGKTGTRIQQVRMDTELLNTLIFQYAGVDFTVDASALQGLFALPDALPYQSTMVAVIQEGGLLLPAFAPSVTIALAAQGGTNNPAVNQKDDAQTSVLLLQGGVSPLDQGQPMTGLFAYVRQNESEILANPYVDINEPLALQLTFTNNHQTGWAPQAVSWNTQLQYPDLSQQRYDPFLPVMMIWNLSIYPLLQLGEDGNYSPDNLTRFFELDPDCTTLNYKVDQLPFTMTDAVKYSAGASMSKKSVYSLTYQIDSYITAYPEDPADPALEAISASYKGRNILSQTMSSLNIEQLLGYYIPQITVENLTMGSRDSVTSAIQQAAIDANAGDNWYDYGFNSEAPIASGPLALGNFGPLRGGFLEINSLELVDVFGQRMQLNTPQKQANGALEVIAAFTMAPMQGDIENAGKVYLPPRIMAPTRLWFKWLSASYNNNVPGIDGDFVEMTSHPVSSPICGWVLPNHLDDSLHFYDQKGAPIGSFGVEHDQIVYRTRAGNTDNPADVMSQDIGPYLDPEPPVNKHVAAFMWYINNKSGGVGTENSGLFLRQLTAVILASDKYIQPSGYGQESALAVLLGRPLAITRSVISLETAGNLLALNQADTSASAPWPTAINAGTTNYKDRMAGGAAGLEQVLIPLQLGDLSNVNDGLIGYLIENKQNNEDPYGLDDFFAPAADPLATNGVIMPSADTIELTLNADPIMCTFLMNPAAAIHATTAILPVAQLGIPADLYTKTLSNLQMTFFTTPMLRGKQQMVVPLPSQSGYVWNWLGAAGQQSVPLDADSADSNAVWGYSPQCLLEGWLGLQPDPDPAPSGSV